MSYYDTLDKYKYAKDYLHNQVVLSCEDFPLLKYNKKLKGLGENDIREIDEILKWKVGAESGDESILKRPNFHVELESDNYRKEPINVINIACMGMWVLFVFLMGAIILGPLTFADHYHIIILHLIVSFICLSIRYFLIASITNNNNFYEKVVPYAFRLISNKKTVPCTDYLLTEFSSDSFSSSFYLKNVNFGEILKINVFYWAVSSLLESQVKSCPDKIFKYYRQSLSDPDCKGVSYVVHAPKPYDIFTQRHPRSDSKSFVSIKEIVNTIFKNEKRYWFLMNIIVPARLDSKVDGNEMYVDQSNLNKFKRNKLNIKGLQINTTYYRTQDTKLSKIYKMAICGILPFAVLYYPMLFRFNYIEDRLKEIQYNALLADYNANVKKLYEIESVDLIVEVSNNQVYNNHVGDDWGTVNRFNDIKLQEGSENIVRYHYGEPINLYTYIVEYDRRKDVSSRNDECNFTKDQLIEGVEVTVDSYVYENRGRYSGCDSKWVTTYKLKVQNPDEPAYKHIEIERSDVVSHLFDNI